MAKRTVIIGGVAGGASTAARLRRRDESMEIVIFERGDYISYANCGLPYHIGGVIRERDALLLQTPASMKARYNIDVYTGHEVVEILPETKEIRVKNLRTGEQALERYDNLVIATGSSPVRPNIPGIDGETIFTLWTIPDMDAIKSRIRQDGVGHASVVGGGFIGLEMAENLRAAGLEVSLIEAQDQVMAPLDAEMAQMLHRELERNQVELILGDGVASFETAGTQTAVRLSSGRTVKTDLVILSIGVRPNSGLAKAAGIALNARGGIVVDAGLQTSIPGIYAVGDVIEVDHHVTREKTMIPLAGPANRQARILADRLAGDSKEYHGSLGTSVARVFGLQAAAVGLNEKALLAAGKVKDQDYHAVLICQKSHAGYYPNASMLALKLLFAPDGKVLGGQIVGKDGADKRIDTIASVMRMHGTIYDLEELELAYAPPFSSAKDPVNMLGFAAENLLSGLVRFIGCDELDQLMQDPEKLRDKVILDVTELFERQAFSLPHSYHIPLGQLRERLEELDREKEILIYCAVGVRAYNASRILAQNGFGKTRVIAGGTSFYRATH